MSEAPDPFAEPPEEGAYSLEESQAIASESRRSLELDRALAGELGQPAPAAPELPGEWLHDLARRRPAGPEDEARLVEEAQSGDAAARARLVEAFLPLIGAVARNYRSSPGLTHTELTQEGVVGLLRALERYDPSLGAPFWSYASWWVRQAMQQLVSELTGPVVLSDRALRQLSVVKEAQAALAREGSATPTLAQLAERTGVGVDQLANLVSAARPPRALDAPVPGEEGAVGTLGELIADPLAEDEYERVISGVAAGELRQLLSCLSDRERAVLRARHGLDGEPESLREIAGRLGVSAERVRQIETRALGKLRAAALPAGAGAG